MTDPKIRVSADVSGVESELQKVQAAAAKINQTLNSGQVGIDAKEAKADLADLQSSASELTKLLDRVKESGEDLAAVDLSAVSDALDDAAKAATALDQVLEAVGQSSGMSATVRNAKAVADNIQRAARAQEVLGREGIKVSRAQAEQAKRAFDQWRQSGARGTSRIRNTEFDDWLSGGWRNYSMDEGESRRHRARVLESVGISPEAGSGGGRGGRNGQSPLAAGLMRRAGPVATAIGGIAGSMTGGGDGGLWGSAGNAGGGALGGLAGFLMGGPAGALIGSMLGSSFLGGIGRSLDSGIDRAGQEGADLTDLRKMLGSTTVDFEQLRGSVRYFAEGLGLTYNEAAKLARSFAHTAGVVDGQSVGREVGSAAGFARGYGMAPETAVQFLATMRHYGQSTGDRDNRKLALNIAEAVQRGGTTAKMDEVLSSIQSFVQNSTRSSLTQANTEAYASFMSSLTGLSMFGMKGDPQAAASAMGQADAALRQGGAFGEASKNFSLGLMQRMLPGFTGFDQDFVSEQGAFGTVGRAFGRDSAAYRLAEARGDSAKMRQYDEWSSGSNSGRTMLSLQMQALEQQYGRNTDEFRKSMQSHFGVSAGQASALYQAYQNDTGLGSLQSTLSASGVDISKLNTKQIAAMAEVANSDDSGIRRQATKLMGLKGSDALNSVEAGDLKKALAGDDPEALRKMVVSLTALHDTTKDQGELMRKQQADMSNAMQKLATELIPLTMDIKDGIIELVKRAAPDSEFVRQQEDEKAKQRNAKSRAATLDGDMASIKRQIDNFKEADRDENGRNYVALHQLKQQREAAAARGDTKAVAAYDANIANMEKAIRAGSPQGKQDLIDRYNSLAAERNGMTNVPGATVQPLEGGSAKPSGAEKPSSTAGKGGDRNARNNNPGNIEYGDFARRHGATGSDGRFAVFPDKETGSRAMDDLLQVYSRQGRKTLRQIIGKWAPSKENDTSGYVDKVAKRLGVGPDDPLNMDDPKIASAVAREMTRIEGDVNAYQNRDDKLPSAGRSLSDGGLDRKAPTGVSPGVQPVSAQRHDIRIDNRVTLLDQNGMERGNSVVQTSVGAPVPQGVAV